MKLPSKYSLVDLLERTLEAHSRMGVNVSVDPEILEVVNTYKKVRRRKVTSGKPEVPGN